MSTESLGNRKPGDIRKRQCMNELTCPTKNSRLFLSFPKGKGDKVENGMDFSFMTELAESCWDFHHTPLAKKFLSNVLAPI